MRGAANQQQQKRGGKKAPQPQPQPQAVAKGGLDFAASREELQEVKFFVASRINEGPVHVSYDDVEDMLRIPEDDVLAEQLLELVGYEQMEFVESVVRKRRHLVDGSLTRSADGLVPYQKPALVTVHPERAPEPVVTAPAPTKEERQKKKKAAAAAAKAAAEVPREECYCMGLQHAVIGNCLSCGKIICALEGSLPCLFCGAELTDLATTANAPSSDPRLAEAVQRKDALLDYERRSVARSMIFDDQADYFSVDSQWMSQEEKTRLRDLERDRREKKARRGMRMAVDLFGRRMVVTEDDSNSNVYEPFDMQELLGDGTTKSTSVFHNPTIVTKGATKERRPEYVPDAAPPELPQDQQSKKKKPQQPQQQKPAPEAEAAKEKAGGGGGGKTRGDAGRIQHRYFELEDAEKFDAPTDRKGAFAVFGVVENVELEQDPARCLSAADRAKTMELCKRKGATHYVLGLVGALPDGDVAACRAAATAARVELVLAWKFAAGFSVAQEGGVAAAASRLVKLCQQHSVTVALVDFSHWSEVHASDKAAGHATLAQAHGAALTTLQALLGSANRVACWVRPYYDTYGGAYSNAAGADTAAALPHVRKYWNELNDLAPKTSAVVMLGMARTGSLGFSREYAEALKAVFERKQRPVIVIDPYPSRHRPLCVLPYSGRQVGLASAWLGLLCCVGSSYGSSQFALSSALEYSGAPAAYDPVAALERAIAAAAFADSHSAEFEALTLVLRYCPTRLQAYYGKGERDLLRKRLDGAPFLDELCAAIALVARSASAWLDVADDVAVFDVDVLQPLRQLIDSKRATVAVRDAAAATGQSWREKKKAVAALRDVKREADAKVVSQRK